MIVPDFISRKSRKTGGKIKTKSHVCKHTIEFDIRHTIDVERNHRVCKEIARERERESQI